MLEVGRFVSVGLVATMVHVITAFAAQTGLGLAPQLANFAGFVCSVLISYFGHSRFTFRAKTRHSVHFPRFVTLALLGLLVSSLTTYFVVEEAGLSFAFAMGFVAVLVPMATFVGAKFWAFAERTDTSSAALSSVALPGAALSFALAGLFLAVMWDRTINHDTSWYLYATRNWLDGARLYVDIIEVNPPLNFYLTVPVIWATDLFGLSAMNAQYLVVAALLGLSLYWVWSMLQAHERLSQSQQVWVIVGAALALTVPATSGVGQREHIMVILITPYLFGFLLSPRPDAGMGGFARGLVASIGLCIKPHFMLFPIALTFVRIVQTRSLAPIWSVSNITIVLVGALYVLMVRAFHPEYLDSVVPMARLVYGDYGFGADVVLERAAPQIILVFCGVAAFLWSKKLWPSNGAVLAAMVFAAILIYAAQWTGYRYQAFPIKAFIGLFCVWVIAVGSLRSIGTATASVLLLLIGADAVRIGFYPSAKTTLYQEVVQGAGPDLSVMSFSTSLRPGFPLVVEAKARWTSRYPALWLVPGALNGLSETDCARYQDLCDQYAAILTDTRRAIVDDFVTESPDVVIFDKRHRYVNQPDFDYRRFLSSVPGFSEQMSKYTHRVSLGLFEIWEKKK